MAQRWGTDRAPRICVDGMLTADTYKFFGDATMQRLWTWEGKYFGHRHGDGLFTSEGKRVGRFRGDEIFDSLGIYLGEVHDSRLVTSKTKRGRMGPRAEPATAATVPPLADVEGKQPLGQFKGFPAPETFR